MKFFRISCQESARLITARLDRELPLGTRLVLRLHLAACDACPRFARQIELMDRAMDRWRGYVERPADD
ncbi:zf-HC2 domain-containing protein [Caldimonas sp. KR1-144]|uniref:zf-HC2 domain-containing protein n=1 Tax=Caldimonas sp. KR1-144 TaxID=3400911 RepID=UPI003BFC1158